MNSDSNNEKLKQSPGPLLQHEPRSGFKARFWARVESSNKVMVNRILRWAVLSTALVGIISGFSVNKLMNSQRASEVNSVGEIQQISGLSIGSLSQTLVFGDKRGGKR